MASAEERLLELGIQLPGLQPAVGNYLAAKRHGDLSSPARSVAARLSKTLEKLPVPPPCSCSRPYELRSEPLNKVASIVKVFGMVNCAPGFNDTVAVIDGCSDLLVDIFGDDIGRHTCIPKLFKGGSSCRPDGLEWA